MVHSHYTIKGNGIHELTIQKSRFITNLRRVADEHDAKNFIDEIKKEHWNAAHNCSAYVIGEQDHIQKANDDGEPSGTAGVPMLNVLLKKELKDIAVVVTRYFGGIKLGAGGLIRAYSNSVTEGIHHTGIIKRKLMQTYTVKTSYEHLGKIENELRQSTYTLTSMDYSEDVTFTVTVNLLETEEFEQWLIDLSNNRVIISKTGTTYMEEDV
ncbi:putative YigZ family protein [Geomicrobium halophilum]|uniref:Putative YigZ family protein n=1 Tax=Geomicrobium halophilum TaxID=549000 RepID=A0A841PNN3_9BACL|nr:YigZ family protein [Geomicrobium halophilum]MBB6450380.1 putative YigZ family protein [Geomicrobium halophilum]